MSRYLPIVLWFQTKFSNGTPVDVNQTVVPRMCTTSEAVDSRTVRHKYLNVVLIAICVCDRFTALLEGSMKPRPYYTRKAKKFLE